MSEPVATMPSWTLGPFIRPAGVNPVLEPDPASVFQDPMRKRPIHWEALHAFNPAAIVHKGKVCILYRAEDDTGAGIGGHTSRLGLAESGDGLHFTRHPAPVFYPAEDNQKENEWDGGCEDPRLVESDGGHYVLTYTQWNHKTARLAIATSRDLLHWDKHGPAFAQAYGGKYANGWSKSGAIVCKLQGGRLKAVQIAGKYWMSWGEGEVHAAWSPDLINWTPVEDPHGALAVMLDRRSDHFDSTLAEGGPPAILTDAGIVVVYNGKNSSDKGDPALGPDAYACGQALFDRNNPTHLLSRLDEPFYKPELPFEKTGQYAAGTTFLEGLVHFKNKWFLYYGCADSKVGVAVYDPKGGVVPEPIPAEH